MAAQATVDKVTKPLTVGKYGIARASKDVGLDMFEVDGELLRDAIAHVVLNGDAILMGLTRDQSALKIQVLTDGGHEDTYVGDTGSCENALRQLRDADV